MILGGAGDKLTQDMFTKRDGIASGQSFCQLEVVACWTNRFAPEDEFLKPHIKKGSVFSDRY